MAIRPRSRVSSVTTPIRLAPTADNGALQKHETIRRRLPSRPELGEQRLRAHRKGRPKRGGSIIDRAPIEASIGEEQEHAREAGGLLLEDDRSHLALCIDEARHRFDTDLVWWMNEQGVDRALFTRIGGDRDLGPPGPCIADGRPQAFEKSQLPNVAERRDRGEGPDRNIETDGRAVASKLQHADVLEVSALERPDQLS